MVRIVLSLAQEAKPGGADISRHSWSNPKELSFGQRFRQPREVQFLIPVQELLTDPHGPVELERLQKRLSYLRS
jgi:hypothetical protein